MNLIELNDERELIINPELYGIKTFKLLSESRAVKGLEYLINELLYVYFMYNLSSDYVTAYSEDERPEFILEELDLPKGWKVDNTLQMFIDYYLQFTETKVGTMLKVAYNLADKVKTYINDMDLEEVDTRTGKPKYVLKDVIDAGNKLTIMVDKIDKIEEIYRKQTIANNKMRGNKTKNAFEDGFGDI